MSLQDGLVATFVDEWARAGVRHAVVAPGSRSAPLALALLADARFHVLVRLDERSAAFTALGIGLATGMPAVLVTTSGTAAAEAHAAVIEADLAGVPMIVCSADRPIELQRVGAPQTIDQRDLFGRSVRSFTDLGAALSPEPAARAAWRSLASRSVLDATAHRLGPGPVHLNVPLREPLLGEAGELPPGRDGGRPWHSAGAVAAAGSAVRPGPVGGTAVEELAAALAGARRLLVVAGGGPAGNDGADLRSAATGLAACFGGAVLADPRAWPREPDRAVVAHADAVLRSARARDRLAPDVVVHLGAPHASKALSSWWQEPALSGARHVLLDAYGRFADAERRADLVLGGDPAELLRAATPSVAPATGNAGYLASWRAAEAAASTAIAAVLGGRGGCNEPATARTLFATLPAGSALVASSSMPVRDLEWFAAPRPGAPVVLANRGANGIDGVVSTALGVATARGAADLPGRTAVLVGDLAFLHDLSALVHGSREAAPDLSVVLLDNGGGGIFSFLPYAGALDTDRFERAFGTPQAADPARVAHALGHRVLAVEQPGALARALEQAGSEPGLAVVVVRSSREANVSLHDEIARAAAEAVDAAL